MLTPPDGRRDGGKLAYLTDTKRRWNAPDEGLFNLLKYATGCPDRRCISELQRQQLIPRAIYFETLLCDNASERRVYIARAEARFAEADLVFFDPDNGLEVPSVPKGRKNSSKYVCYDEVEAFFRSGKSVLIYKHFPFEKRGPFISRVSATLAKRSGADIIRVFRTPHVALFMAAQRRHRRLADVPLDRLGALKVCDAGESGLP